MKLLRVTGALILSVCAAAAQNHVATASAAELAPQLSGGLPHDSPEGHYVVLVYAGWAQTTPQGEFYLEPGGLFRDVWNNETGRYTYDRSTRAVRFLSGAYSEASVVFDPALHGRGALKITWQGIDPIWAYREPTPVGARAGGAASAPNASTPAPKVSPPAPAPAPSSKNAPPTSGGGKSLADALERIEENWSRTSTPGERGTVLLELAALMGEHPGAVEPMLVAASFYLELEDYKLAESQAKAILELDGRPSIQSQAYRLLALAYESTGRTDQAITAYRDSAALMPDRTRDRSDALVYLGVALGAAERHSEAERVLRDAIAADAENSSAHGELGNALARQGRNADAAASYRRALALNPDDEGARGNLKIVESRLRTTGR